jgi:hypothetical protein
MVTVVAALPGDVATIAPVASGGMIPNGTYELTRATIDDPDSSILDTEIKAVVQVSGNSMQQVRSIDGEERRFTASYTLSNSTITTTVSCPEPDTSTDSFSLTIDTDLTTAGFIIRQDINGATLELSYVKR